jgi:hypothetical protein
MDKRYTPVILIGGPYDGEELQVDLHHPQDIRMPVPSLPLWAYEKQGMYPTANEIIVLRYDLVLDDLGYPSRDDQGRIRYKL